MPGHSTNQSGMLNRKWVSYYMTVTSGSTCCSDLQTKRSGSCNKTRCPHRSFAWWTSLTPWERFPVLPFSNCQSTGENYHSRFGDGAFAGCTSKASSFRLGLKALEAFWWNAALLWNTSSSHFWFVKISEHCVFIGRTSLENTTILSFVTKIGHCPFHGCSSLRGIIVLNSVTCMWRANYGSMFWEGAKRAFSTVKEQHTGKERSEGAYRISRPPRWKNDDTWTTSSPTNPPPFPEMMRQSPIIYPILVHLC